MQLLLVLLGVDVEEAVSVDTHQIAVEMLVMDRLLLLDHRLVWEFEKNKAIVNADVDVEVLAEMCVAKAEVEPNCVANKTMQVYS